MENWSAVNRWNVKGFFNGGPSTQSPKQFPSFFSTIRRSKIRLGRDFPDPTP